MVSIVLVELLFAAAESLVFWFLLVCLFVCLLACIDSLLCVDSRLLYGAAMGVHELGPFGISVLSFG